MPPPLAGLSVDEEARDAFVRSLEHPGAHASLQFEAARLLNSWGESALAVRFVERVLATESTAFRKSESYGRVQVHLETFRKDADRERLTHERHLPRFVQHVVSNLTRHKRAIPPTYMTFDKEQGCFVLKKEYQSALWSATVTIPEGEKWVIVDHRESYVAKDDAWKRFDDVLEELRSRRKKWNRRFRLRKKLPDVVCEEWAPPDLPFPESGIQVQRRIVFRWGVTWTTRRYTDTIATLSILQFRHASREDPDGYGDHYVLRLVMFSKDFA